MLVRPSRRRISRSSFSMPECAGSAKVAEPRQLCLSKRYARRFFLSSGRPSRRTKRCASSRRMSWAAMMEAAAASRTTREESEEVSVRAWGEGERMGQVE